MGQSNAVSFLLVVVAAAGCAGPSLPRPPMSSQRTNDLVEVPFPPPPARPELVPPQPREGAVWIDGEWSFERRWSWQNGRWVVPPKGATYSPWTSVRGPDGRLWFAAGTWRNEAGEPIPPPRPLARGGATERDLDEDAGVEGSDRDLLVPSRRPGERGCPPVATPTARGCD